MVAGKLDVHSRHSMLSFLISLPISILRSSDTEANKFYDRSYRLYDAALLTKCYSEHALHPIDFKTNHVRHFIKIPFINKGMDFIDLPSTFRDKSVQSAVPNYFKNCEVPIICYEYIKPIRSAIFNFNKVVPDLDIETCNPDSFCRDSKYVYPAAGYLDIVGQGPSALAEGAGGGCLDIFTLIYPFSPLSPDGLI